MEVCGFFGLNENENEIATAFEYILRFVFAGPSSRRYQSPVESGALSLDLLHVQMTQLKTTLTSFTSLK